MTFRNNAEYEIARSRLDRLDAVFRLTKFADPRVQRLLTRCLSWCDLNLHRARSRPIYADQLLAVFGTTSTTGTRLGAKLRRSLVVQTKKYRVSDETMGIEGWPSEYRLDQYAWDWLRTKVTGDLERDDAYPDLREQLDSLEFSYKDSANRYWHSLQNLKRESKASFWRGRLPYNYDVVACAPTLLLQLAERSLGHQTVLLADIRAYIDDRRAFRERIAAVAGITVDEAKGVINALFNGAKICRNRFSSVYRSHGVEAVNALLKDRELTDLRRAIRVMWRYIGKTCLSNAWRKRMGYSQVRRSTSKWAIYYQCERQVLDAAGRWFTERGVKHFDEHDGFRTDRSLDLASLVAFIKAETGFVVEFEGNHDA